MPFWQLALGLIDNLVDDRARANHPPLPLRKGSAAGDKRIWPRKVQEFIGIPFRPENGRVYQHATIG
jgi:hypothetical protein